MTRSLFRPLVAGMTLGAFLVGSWCGSAAQGADDAQPVAQKVPDKKAPAGKGKPGDAPKGKGKAGNRLPPYFADVVDDAQKEKIYEVQNKYAAQLKALQDQLDALRDKRDGEIEALLTPDQRAKIDAARAAKKKKPDDKKKAA